MSNAPARLVSRVLLIHLLTALFASAGHAETSEAPGDDGTRRRATLLVTAGLSGRLVDGERTVADLVATIRELAEAKRAEGRAVALVDAGVTLVPYAESRFDDGATMLRALAAAGVEVFAPHPVDLSVGAERLSEIAETSPVAILRAFDTDETTLAELDAVARLDLDGVPVEVRAFDHPAYVGDLAANGFSVRTREPAGALADVERSGSEPTALQVAVLHSRGDGTGIASRRMTWSLVEEPSGFDLLIDPDLEADLVLRRDGVDGRSHPVFLVGRQLSTALPWDVAAIDLELSRDVDGAWRIDDVQQNVHRVDPEATPDPELVATIRRAFEAFRDEYGDELPAAAPSERDSLEAFVLGAVREAGNAEIAILNQGSLRPVDPVHFEPPLTRETVMRLLSYDQDLVVGTLTGEQLEAVVAESLTRIDDEGSPRQSSLRFLGLDFTVEGAGGPDAAARDYRVNGRRLYPGDRYRVATNAFLAGGGDGYPILADMSGERVRRDAEVVEIRETVVLPRLQRADVPLEDPAEHGLWRFGVLDAELGFDRVTVDADPAYGDVSDSRASAEDSRTVRGDLRLFADQEWTKIRWENRLRARFGILDTESEEELTELTDDLRFDSSIVFLDRPWLRGHPYLGYTLDTELRPDRVDDRRLPRQWEQSLAVGLEWRGSIFERVRLGLLARAQNDTETADRLGVVVESDIAWQPPAPWPELRARLLAETVEDDDATIDRVDLELRLPVAVIGRLSVSPGLDLYRFRDSRLPGTASYERFLVSLSWDWTGKHQRTSGR